MKISDIIEDMEKYFDYFDVYDKFSLLKMTQKLLTNAAQNGVITYESLSTCSNHHLELQFILMCLLGNFTHPDEWMKQISFYC